MSEASRRRTSPSFQRGFFVEGDSEVARLRRIVDGHRVISETTWATYLLFEAMAELPDLAHPPTASQVEAASQILIQGLRAKISR